MIFLVDFSSKCGIMINKRKVIELEKKFANLHVHSTHSDGAFSPKELVRLAKEEGYGAVAMTDHDTATGCDELKEEAAAAGLMSVMGVEFSCTAPELNANFHMVGFDFDPNVLISRPISCAINPNFFPCDFWLSSVSRK